MSKNIETMTPAERLAHDTGFADGWDALDASAEGIKFGKAEKRKELRGNTAKMSPVQKLAFYRARIATATAPVSEEIALDNVESING